MPPSGAIETIHIAAASAALMFGSVALFDAKGDRQHRLWGAAYVLAVLTLNVSSFGLYRLLGSFGPFHVVALASLGVLTMGVVAVLRRRPGWLLAHRRWMIRSYLILLAAATIAALVRLPVFGDALATPRRIIFASLGIAALFALIGRFVVPREKSTEGRIG